MKWNTPQPKTKETPQRILKQQIEQRRGTIVQGEGGGTFPELRHGVPRLGGAQKKHPPKIPSENSSNMGNKFWLAKSGVSPGGLSKKKQKKSAVGSGMLRCRCSGWAV